MKKLLVKYLSFGSNKKVVVIIKAKLRYLDVKHYVKEFIDLLTLNAILLWYRSKNLNLIYDPNRTANIALIFTQMEFYPTYSRQIYPKVIQ